MRWLLLTVLNSSVLYISFCAFFARAGDLVDNAHFALYYNPGGLWSLGRAALAIGHE